ncbi:MAG: RHS repeat-associated core domain-containing protein [Pseudomonadota bacterium]
MSPIHRLGREVKFSDLWMGTTYDHVGNRLSSTNTTTEWGYDDNNELIGYNDVSLSYDLNGSLIVKTQNWEITTFENTIENQIKSVHFNSADMDVSYYYDPFGRRLYEENIRIKKYFFYTNEGMVGEYDNDGKEVKSYVWKTANAWSTDPLLIKNEQNYYIYQNDSLGTPHVMTTENGTIVWSAKYDSFGNAILETETVNNDIRFPGQFYDDILKLNYNYNRYYNSFTGSYLQKDKMYSGSELNLYVYARNNPLRFMDPFGLNSSSGKGHLIFRCVVQIHKETNKGLHYLGETGLIGHCFVLLDEAATRQK